VSTHLSHMCQALLHNSNRHKQFTLERSFILPYARSWACLTVSCD
jgi:hypothetical protein